MKDKDIEWKNVCVNTALESQTIPRLALVRHDVARNQTYERTNERMQKSVALKTPNIIIYNSEGTDRKKMGKMCPEK